jgi:hypothetical protein
MNLVSRRNDRASSPRTPEARWPGAEQRLLLEAALWPGERGITAFRAWRSLIDPEQQFGWSIVRLLPLVYDNLRRQGLQDPLMARLKGVYRRAWCENNRLFHAVAPVIDRLAANGGEVLLLKGAPLVRCYYRNLALRPMADLDVVVRESRLAEAMAILRASGYRSRVAMTSDLQRFSHALQFVHPKGAQIDLHWHVLFEAPSEGADRAFWAATEAGEFLGIPVRQPDPTSLLLQVIIHGVRANEEPPIRWIPDALTILRTPGTALDWQRLVDLALSHKLTHRLGLGLRYLAESFEVTIPAAVLPALTRQRSVLERIENTVMLADWSRFTGTALGTQWVNFTEYCRYAKRGSPWAFLEGYSEYLRYRLGLNGRREIIPIVVRGLGRRLTNGKHLRAIW